MSYKGVKRAITIHIHRSHRKSPYTIDVVPEHAEAVPGDTVEWHIQGAPAGVNVTVGNFVRCFGPQRVRFHEQRARVLEQPFPEKTIRKTPYGLSCKILRLQPGIYKYDVLFDDVTVLDPELEVPRPGRV